MALTASSAKAAQIYLDFFRGTKKVMTADSYRLSLINRCLSVRLEITFAGTPTATE